MNILELLFVGIGLAMDAVAVAVCKGMVIRKLTWKKSIIVGLYFGTFQAIMPIIGFVLGFTFNNFVRKIDHWITFLLLVSIGINMIIESFSKEGDEQDDKINFKSMFILSVATSIDALAVGVTFAFLKVSILPAVVFIGVTTFVFSAAGVKIGSIFGAKYHAKAELLGGVVLIIIALKILLEGIGAL